VSRAVTQAVSGRVALAAREREDGAESRDGEQVGRRLRNHGAWSCTAWLEAVDEVSGQNVVLPEAGPRARREPCKHRSRGPPIKGSESLTYLEDRDLNPTDQGVRVLDLFGGQGLPIKGLESLTYLEDKDLDPMPRDPLAIKGSESLTYLEDKDLDPTPRDPLAERPMSFDRKQETMLHPVVSQRSHDGAV